MASLAYPGGRCTWLTVDLSDATEAISKCVPVEEEGNIFRKIITKTNALDLSWPLLEKGSGDPGTGTIEWEFSPTVRRFESDKKSMDAKSKSGVVVID